MFIKSRGKGSRLNNWRNFCAQIDQQEGLLIEAQNILDLNPLFPLAKVRQQHDTGTQNRSIQLRQSTVSNTGQRRRNIRGKYECTH